MSSDLDTLDLSELAAESGVSPRTIRYYVQQGLLPSPGTRGPNTRYDRAYLDRLQLIKLLQRQHLPLAEIRRRLEALDDDGVRVALESLPPEPPRTSALDYVRQVLMGGVAPMAAAEADSFAAMAPPPPAAARAPAPAAPPTTMKKEMAQKGPTRSQWERVALDQDIELHIRRPLSREGNRRVERLLDAARRIFSEEP